MHEDLAVSGNWGKKDAGQFSSTQKKIAITAQIEFQGGHVLWN